MKCINISDINAQINENVEKFINDSENQYHNNIILAAEKIMQSGKPIVLISGPSGSGKTTSALRISKVLNEKYGIHGRVISMDNYFLPSNVDNIPRDENGNMDLESPYRLDVELLKKHMGQIADCEEIKIPIFDFATQSISGYVPYKRSESDVLIIEGIHALNPLVTGKRNDATCIYVSVRTRLIDRCGERLHPRKIRLMRRLIRDNMFRGRKLEEISDMFESVSRGEDLYIMPYKTRADFDIDTFMAFEPSVYSSFLIDGLKKMSTCNGYESCQQILKFISELNQIDAECVHDTSLVREFIGGSSFIY